MNLLFILLQMVTAQSVQEIVAAVQKKQEEDRLTLLRKVDKKAWESLFNFSQRQVLADTL